MKTSLIIPAAGKNSRLSKYYFPKVLLPLHNKAIITRIIEFWNADEVIIVANSQNLDIIKQYTENKYIYVVENRRGSAFAIESGVKEATYKRIIANWCDVIPTENIELSGNLIFTSTNIVCRYNGKTGGFYGVFSWDKDIVKIECENAVKELDLLDILNLNQFSEIVVSALDIGDLEKYSENLRISENPIRSFNKIIIGENTVTKICNDEKLKFAEENWYKELSHLDFIPKPVSYDPLILQKINGTQKFYEVKPLYELAKRIHESKTPIIANKEDCLNMYIYKTIDRLKQIDYLFPFKNQFVVNGISCTNPVDVLSSLDISNMIPENFTPIHGDLTTSNVLWEKDVPYIIDPRGTFGNTILYGDPDYDIAKIYYSLTDWHLLNKGALCSAIINENSFVVQDIKEFGNKKIDFLLAIIWLSVTEYVKSNVLSVMYSYLTGSYLLSRWMENNNGT